MATRSEEGELFCKKKTKSKSRNKHIKHIGVFQLMKMRSFVH